MSEGLIEVCNKGEGVDAVVGSDLFKPFVRGENQQQTDGHGVGLDIVKRLCELYDWKVDYHFSAERGMVFRVRF